MAAKKSTMFFSCLIIIAFLFLRFAKCTYAYSEKNFYITNMTIPAVLGAIKAYYEGTPIPRAFFQGAFGGFMMQEGLKGIANAENKSSGYAWRNKIIFNIGSSLAECAGSKDTVFRMDMGPVWLTFKDNKVKYQLGLNSTVVVLSHFIEGSKIDFKRSFKYGTFAFEKKCNKDGTLLGSSALAYSNANIITTNSDGEHAGHELTHTFQYRRDMMSPLKLSNVIPRFRERIGDLWFDDTGWTANWGLQCAWADIRHKDKSFEIPLEKEAYWLEGKYKTNYNN